MRYRRNADIDLRELERQAMATGDPEIIERFKHSYARATDHDVSCSSVQYYLQDKAANKKIERAIASYEASWPKYCRDCHGWGGKTSYYDPSPAGVGLSPGSMADFDPCPTCVEQGICPRCGEESADLVAADEYSDKFACELCGWDELNNNECIPESDPYPLECDCWEWQDVYQRNPVEDDPRCQWVQLYHRPLRYERCFDMVFTGGLCHRHHMLWRNLERVRLREQGLSPDIWSDDEETKT